MSMMRPQSTNFIWLENYRQLFQNKDFLKSVQTSLVFTSWVVLFQFLFGFLLALLMANKRRLVSVVRMSVMLPWVLPPIALALIWAWVLKAGNTGLVNSVLINFGVQPV